VRGKFHSTQNSKSKCATPNRNVRGEGLSQPEDWTSGNDDEAMYRLRLQLWEQ
jgi:hypothetical protein